MTTNKTSAIAELNKAEVAIAEAREIFVLMTEQDARIDLLIAEVQRLKMKLKNAREDLMRAESRADELQRRLDGLEK